MKKNLIRVRITPIKIGNNYAPEKTQKEVKSPQEEEGNQSVTAQLATKKYKAIRYYAAFPHYLSRKRAAKTSG
jgi:hypothetical protein